MCYLGKTTCLILILVVDKSVDEMMVKKKRGCLEKPITICIGTSLLVTRTRILCQFE